MSDTEELTSVVKNILEKNNAKLKSLIATVLQGIAGELLEVGLIDQEVDDSMRGPGTEAERAGNLLSKCKPTIFADPRQNFPKFIKVLKKHRILEPLASGMESEFKQPARKPGGSASSQQSTSGSQQSTGASKQSAGRQVTLGKSGGGVSGGGASGGGASGGGASGGGASGGSQAILDHLKAWAYMYLGIPGLLLAIVCAWFVVAPPSTLPSTPSSTPPSMPLLSPDNALTCKWPKPNSNPVLLQEKQIMMELDVEEMSDKLKSSVEQVGKALIAGEKCKDPELHDKMNLVDTTVRKINKKVQEVYGGFHNGAETALTNLRSMSDFATKGNMVEAMQQMDTVCETTEALAQQLDSLKGSMHTKGTELRQALKDLEKYQEKAKDNHEGQQDKVRAEKQQYERERNAAATSAREADEKASSAATNAKKEMEAWEELKRNNDAFGSNDQNPFKKRRDQFLKDQQTFETEAEDSRRIVEQAQLKITAIGKNIETANIAFKCTNDAITKMKEAAGSVSRSMPAVSVSLFEEGLKKECTDLHDTIKSISSSGGPKGTWPSQVCNKAIKLFAKWQALSKVSFNYFSIGNM